jgi:hypothetical protein
MGPPVRSTGVLTCRQGKDGRLLTKGPTPGTADGGHRRAHRRVHNGRAYAVSVIPEVQTQVERAIAGSGDWSTVAERLRVSDIEPIVIAAHRAAFSYMYVESSSSDQRSRYGPLAPVWETQTSVYPAPIDHLPDGAAEGWADAFDAIDAPLLRSRYGDLLWLCRHGEAPYRYAHSAMLAYELLAGGDDELLTATHSTQRAVELAQELNDADATSRLAVAAVERAAQILGRGVTLPGVVMRLLEVAASVRPGLRPGRLLEVVLLAETVYGADPWLGDAVADLLSSLSSEPAERDAVHRRQLDRWRGLIGATYGIARQAHLQHALELAALHRLPDVLNALRRDLQESRDDPLELHAVSSEVALPKEDLDRAISLFVGDDSVVLAFRRLGAHSPLGDDSDNRRLAEEIIEANPFQFLVSRVIVSDENLPIRILQTREEHLEGQLRRQEMMRIRVFGAALLLPAIDRIIDRYGLPTVEAVAESLAGPLVDSDTARHIALAIVAFLQSDFDRAAHTLTPRLERVFRTLARQAGVVVVREPIGSTAGGVRSLGAVLAALDGVLDPRWRRYFVNALCDELGLNLRNRIAHGLINEVQREDVAVLVHIAIALSLFRIERGSGNAASPNEDDHG